MAPMPFAAGVAMLVFVTLVWGTSFVVVKEALDTIPVPLLLALRFSATALLFVWVPLDRRAVRPALVLGLLAFAGFGAQTIALTTSGASQVAFITGTAVILTPAISAVWLRNRVPRRAYAAGTLALVGLGLLTLQGGGAFEGLGSGDLWALLCAACYAGYIVVLGEVAGKVSALSLAGLQHLPMAALAWAWAAPSLAAIASTPAETFLAIAYLAAICTALVAVLQTYAQRVVPAYLAALIFVLEPVFASMFAFWLLGERLGPLGWLGGALVVLAMLVAELRRPAPRRAGVQAAPPDHPAGEHASGSPTGP